MHHITQESVIEYDPRTGQYVQRLGKGFGYTEKYNANSNLFIAQRWDGKDTRIFDPFFTG
jgi:hypothetical protein